MIPGIMLFLLVGIAGGIYYYTTSSKSSVYAQSAAQGVSAGVSAGGGCPGCPTCQ